MGIYTSQEFENKFNKLLHNFLIHKISFNFKGWKIDVIFEKNWIKNYWFVIVVTDEQKQSYLFFKFFKEKTGNFKKNLPFKGEMKGKRLNKFEIYLLGSLNNKEKPKGEKLDEFWIELLNKLEPKNQKEVKGTFFNSYNLFNKEIKDFGIYIASYRKYELSDRKLSFKMKQHLKQNFGINKKVLFFLEKNNFTICTTWDPKKENKTLYEQLKNEDIPYFDKIIENPK